MFSPFCTVAPCANPFFINKGPFKVSDILSVLNLDNVDIDMDRKITDIKDLFTSNTNEITFFHSKKYKDIAENTKASFCITTENLKNELNKNCKPLIVNNVLVSTSLITAKFYPESINDNFDILGIISKLIYEPSMSAPAATDGSVIYISDGLFKYSSKEIVDGIDRAMGTNLFNQITFDGGIVDGRKELRLNGDERSQSIIKGSLHYDTYRGVGLMVNYQRISLNSLSKKLGGIKFVSTRDFHIRVRHMEFWWVPFQGGLQGGCIGMCAIIC